MYPFEGPSLPPLGNDDSEACALDSLVCCETAPLSTNMLFEAKALSLVPRPKTTPGLSRSSSGSVACTPPSSKSRSPPHWAPRHAKDMTRSPSAEAQREIGDTRERPSVGRKRTTGAEDVPDGSANVFLSRDLAASPAAGTHHERETQEGCPRESNETPADSMGSFVKPFQAMDSPKRIGIETESNESSTGGNWGVGSSGITMQNIDDPDALRRQIRRLQASLLNELKGGTRLVGGGQFKAPISHQGSPCGSCLQVREALRRSRVEIRDLRAGLFLAKAEIKQLKLVRGTRRYRAKTRDPIGGVRRASFSGSGRRENAYGTALVSPSSQRMKTESSREKLMTRVRQQEEPRCLLPDRNTDVERAAARIEGNLSTFPKEETRGKCDEGSPPWPEDETRGAGAEHLPPCMRCSELRMRTEEQESNLIDLAKQNKEQEQELDRLQGIEAKVDAMSAQMMESRRRVQDAERRSEEHGHARVRLERERADAEAEKQRISRETDSWKTQALEMEGHVRRLSGEYEVIRSDASATSRCLEQTQRDLDAAHRALVAERTMREREEGASAQLSLELTVEREDVQKLRKQASTERDLRRRSEVQAGSAESAHRDALKAALSNSVRLCVVAPTVNINLGDRRQSFSSGLPEEKIRDFVECSVLPRFTRVLFQPGVDTKFVTAADGSAAATTTTTTTAINSASTNPGSTIADSSPPPEECAADFDKWLRDLLMDMQASIESHVASVFQAQTTHH